MLKHAHFISGITEFFLDNQLIMMCSCLALAFALAVGHTKYLSTMRLTAAQSPKTVLAQFVEHTSVPKGVIPVKAVIVAAQYTYIKTLH